MITALPDVRFIPTDGSPMSDAHTAATQPQVSTRHQIETIKAVGPNLYVALAAVHFKNHTSTGANKPGQHQLMGTVYAKIILITQKRSH